MLKSALRTARNVALSVPWRILGATGLYRPAASPVAFVIERDNWSIRWDGLSICAGVNERHPDFMEVTTRPQRLYRRTVHFGSQFMWQVWHRHMTPRNRYVMTYFHGKREDSPVMDRHIDAFLAGLDRLDRVVTAARMVEQRLLGWGVPPTKLVRIPIGVDTRHFRPPREEERAAARRKFGVPDGCFCIGSFQKDGVGWGQGMEPKLVKGPDIFTAAAARLARDFPVFVLLTGPARGFVKAELERHGIPYAHDFVEHYPDLRERFHALDLYLVTSREEGGPKAVLEGAATGVPVVSTRVGMAPDVIEDGVTGALVEVDAVDELVARAGALLADDAGRAAMAAAARAGVGSFDWQTVADAHYEKVYRPLVQS